MVPWFCLTFGMVLSNFIYQAVTDKDYSVALERSYFMVAAVIIIVIGKPWKGW